MSTPNPPNASRRHYRRFSDERIWREFFAACIPVNGVAAAARLADEAYAEYRNRFPVREPEDEETAAPDSEATATGVQ